MLAKLSRVDFERAKLTSSHFDAWVSYGDFSTERDALLLTYATCGIAASMQRLAFPAFERWSRLTGAPLDLDGLDEFAAHWRWRNARPDAPVRGTFGVPRFPETQEIEAAGVQVIRVRPELFVRWRDGYARAALFETPGLDDYASHVVECCIPFKPRSRRPDVSSQ